MDIPYRIDPATLQADPRLRQLAAILQRIQVRLRLREAASLVPIAAALGLGAALLLSFLWRFYRMMPLPTLLLVAAGLVLVACVTAWVYSLVRPRDLMATARRADLLLSLDERLSTALEDAARPPQNPTHEQVALREAQLEDALASATRIEPKRDLPVQWERRGMLPAALLATLALLVLVAPNPFVSPEERATQAQVSIEQRRIEELKKAVESQPSAATDPTLQELLRQLDELSEDLAKEGISREEALAQLSEAERELQKALDPQAPAERAALDELARQLAASQDAAARKAGEALREGEPEKASEALKDAGRKASEMSPEERQALAQALRQARDSVVSLDPELARRLSEAADALESNDPKAAEEALKNAGEYLEESSRNAASQEQVRQALAQIQQSKSGIAQAGQATPMAITTQMRTAFAQGTQVSGVMGTPVSGTPISGTPIVLGSPVSGQLSATGTPVIVPGGSGTGTPVVVQGQGQGQGQGQQGQSQPSGGWGTEHKEPVYAPPSSVDANLTPVVVQGQQNPGGEQSSTTTNTDINRTGAAQVPYDQVYGEYKERAGQALDTDYIPQGYKDLVRDYFTHIEPEDGP